MFEGFREDVIDTAEARILVRHGGTGAPVVLLHGHPRTSATWHRVAPLLVAAGRTVVCPDLRGYGRSIGPAPTADHSAHSKAAMARDVVEVMAELGHDRFDVVGHDRGSYVGFALALNHPDRVRRVALLEGIPIVEHLERITPQFATDWWHWFFFAQPDKPERAIGADPEAWYHPNEQLMGAESLAEWRTVLQDPAVIRAMLEDYRAGLTVDRVAEEQARREGRRVLCPLLIVWALHDDLAMQGDPVEIWRSWADDVRGRTIDCGHHIAEERPEELAEALDEFLRA